MAPEPVVEGGVTTRRGSQEGRQNVTVVKMRLWDATLDRGLCLEFSHRDPRMRCAFQFLRNHNVTQLCFHLDAGLLRNCLDKAESNARSLALHCCPPSCFTWGISFTGIRSHMWGHLRHPALLYEAIATSCLGSN